VPIPSVPWPVKSRRPCVGARVAVCRPNRPSRAAMSGAARAAPSPPDRAAHRSASRADHEPGDANANAAAPVDPLAPRPSASTPHMRDTALVRLEGPSPKITSFGPQNVAEIAVLPSLISPTVVVRPQHLL